MNTIKIIQAGLGAMGSNWLKLIDATPGVETVACVDTSSATLERLEQAGKRGYTSFEEALRHEQADAVLIATPPDLHEPVAVQAAAAGLHILCEKPLADTLAAAQRMTEAAETANVLLMVAQNRRHNPFIHTLRQLVGEGRYGQPGQVYVTFRQIFTRDSFRDDMVHPLLVDMANHHFDTIRYVFGQEPVGVMGTAWNPGWSRFKGAASAIVVFAYASGMRVVYDGSWHTIDADMTSNGCDWRIECERGVYACKNEIVYEGARGDAASGSYGRALQPVKMLQMQHQAGAYLLDEFMRAIRGETTPQTTGRDNLKTLALVLAAVEAVDTSQYIRLA